MNLVEQVGWEHFSGRFAGCIFLHEGRPHIIQGINSSRSREVTCKEVESPKTLRNVELPFEVFYSFNFLKVPPLGWRCTDSGRVLVMMSRNNTSYTRGVTTKNIVQQFAAHTEYMFSMGKLAKEDMELPGFKALMVTRPEHMPMAEGIDALNKGRILSFTNSEHIAVVPESDSVYNIFCETAHVANVSPEGEVTVLPGNDDFDLEIMQ